VEVSARRDDRGIALVEFALVLPVLILLIVGVFDLALAVWQSNTLATAVRDGTRYAIVHGSAATDPSGPGDDDAIESLVQTNAIGLSGVTVTVTWPDGDNERGHRVRVIATVPYKPVLSQMFTGGGLNVTLRAGSELVIHR
jgi:Flp pilus assembly protein TadG